MNQFLNKLWRQLLSFISDQYIVLFLMLTTAYKQFLFNSNILHKGTWSNSQLFFILLGSALIFSPLLFVKRHKNKIAILLSFLISFLLVVDTVYYSYFTALPTVGLLGSIGQTESIGPAIEALLQWWLILYFIDIALILIFYKPLKKLFVKLKVKFNVKKTNIKTDWAFMVVIVVAFLITFMRMGGVDTLSGIFEKGFDTVSTANYYGVLAAHVIDVSRFIREETTSLSSSQIKALDNWVKNNQPKQATDSLTGLAKGKNVIMIQVESMGGFVMNQKVNGKELMPNLDKLAKSSQFFPNDRFEIGEGHTSDTDFVANSSYFPMSDAAVFVRFGQDDFNSLPKTLISNGYTAYAYHGFNRNFWNRNVALKSLGYQKFYAADNYPKGFDINMGLDDGDFLSTTADYIKKQPKPSFSYAITLSSHVPFSTNDQTDKLGVDQSKYPPQVGGYLDDINYTDSMLGNFFAKLKSEGLYDNSLILVYGDHTPVLPAFSAGTINYDPSTVQQKEVPLIVKLPNETVGKTYVNQGTHFDIMPTILDLLGIKTNQLMFGQSLFASGKNALKVCSEQIVTFPSSGNCNDMLTTERNQSDAIIRYNEFSNLPK
ncbi:MAG TPA: LTA synthase family protein [Candidatus Saccharimonadales bacterium]|nr:LTA synthase family protein [Candidatus Saccharimonadales bacterium]